eukprot:4669798-Alexandrium_andersonii.AAC.1
MACLARGDEGLLDVARRCGVQMSLDVVRRWMRVHAEVEMLEVMRGAELRQHLQWLADHGPADMGGAAHGRARTEQLLSRYLGSGVASQRATRDWQRRHTRVESPNLSGAAVMRCESLPV